MKQVCHFFCVMMVVTFVLFVGPERAIAQTGWTGTTITFDHCVMNDGAVQPLPDRVNGYRLVLSPTYEGQSRSVGEPFVPAYLTVELQTEDGAVRPIELPKAPVPSAMPACDSGGGRPVTIDNVRLSGESLPQIDALVVSLRGRKDLFLTPDGAFSDLPFDPADAGSEITLGDLVIEALASGTMWFLNDWPYTVQMTVAGTDPTVTSRLLHMPDIDQSAVSSPTLLEAVRIRFPEMFAHESILRQVAVSPDKCSGPSRYLPGGFAEISVQCQQSPPFTLELGSFRSLELSGWTNELDIEDFFASVSVALTGDWPLHADGTFVTEDAATTLLDDGITISMFADDHPAADWCRVEIPISTVDLINGTTFSMPAPCEQIPLCEQPNDNGQSCLIPPAHAETEDGRAIGVIVLPKADGLEE